jgi:hypothetical protein
MIGLDVFYVSRFPWVQTGENWQTYAARPQIRLDDVERFNELIAETGSRTLELAVPGRRSGRRSATSAT